MKTRLKIFTTILSVLACCAFLPQMRAQLPTEIPGNPDGCYPAFTTAEGCNALHQLFGGLGNTAVGWYSLFLTGDANFNTALGAGTLALTSRTGVGTDANDNTAVGTAAMILNISGSDNTAVGTNALVNNTIASHNNGVGSFALYNNDASGSGVANSNNAFGDSALFSNVIGAANTAIGYYTLWNNDSDALGLSNNNTAVGAVALFNNVDGSENTAVGTGAGQNVITGFNNTYVGDFVGTTLGDEDNTIRIGDVSNGNGAGSLECYIGGIFNNFQAVGGTVVQVTLDLADDHLGWDFGPSQGDSAPEQRSAPQRRSAPGAPTQRPAMLKGKVGKVEKLEATVAQQQRQIGQQQKQIETLTAQLREQAETFTAQLKEQATQIQKVSDQLAAASPSDGGLEVSKFAIGRIRRGGPAPQVVNNP